MIALLPICVKFASPLTQTVALWADPPSPLIARNLRNLAESFGLGIANSADKSG